MIMRNWFILILVMVAMVVFGGGCGIYTFNPSGKSSIKSIAVLPFENQTDQYELTDRLTEIIVDQFIEDGNLKVLPESSADAVLSGVLVRYQRVANVYTETDEVTEYKVLMDFRVTLTDPKEGKELWTEQMNQEGSFDASAETEEDGQSRAGQRLVEAIINRTTKSW